ncbi:uncharacterized protein PAC_05944 [Phialocephala subalpina]|uniref:2EXR domain-containing protein n=1 Tax=Phialocephala subalpina TaxID=576137 RepID=A0A1L7WTI4_9HELO|nr:uncharacterized protein PAC_05944 [Phialocephala subalpina]
MAGEANAEEDIAGTSSSIPSSDNVITVDLQTFLCFKKLPIELRLKIWRIASFTQRNVDIWSESLEIISKRGRDSEFNFVLHALHSTRPTPTVLHACQESRGEGLKHYSLEFGASQEVIERNSKFVPGRPLEMRGWFTLSTPPMYINWAVDRGLKYLALNTHSPKKVTSWSGPPTSLLLRYNFFFEPIPLQGQLEKLILFDEHGWGNRDTGDNEAELKAADLIAFGDIPQEKLTLDEKLLNTMKRRLNQYIDYSHWINNTEREQMKSLKVRPYKILGSGVEAFLQGFGSFQGTN